MSKDQNILGPVKACNSVEFKARAVDVFVNTIGQ